MILSTQTEIDQMRYEKACKIAHHAVLRQQNVQKCHIHGRGRNVVAHADLLLPQALVHGIRNGIAVQHRNQQSVLLQIVSCCCAVIEF